MRKASLAVLILLAISNFAHAVSRMDSIGITKINSKIFYLHRVIEGETFYRLAARYNASPAQIQHHNGGINVLSIGQVLIIPADSSKHFPNPLRLIHVHTVVVGDHLQKIADMYGMKLKRLNQINAFNNPQLAEGQAVFVELVDKITLEQRTPSYYEVKKGDTYYGIAKLHGTSLDSIFWWNGIDVRTKLSIGQKLIVGFGEVRANPLMKSYELKESGIGERIADRGQRSTQDFALHTDLPYGSMVKVTNPSNGVSTMVKVIGKLSSRDKSKKIVLKLSKSACDKLGILTPTFPIFFEYD